jgi:hypothetical protein
VEKLWFFYKDRQMKQLVLDWFNGVRESRGLEALKPEIFEGEDLVLSDFTIRQVEDEAVLQTVKYLDRRVFAEIFPDPEEAAYWYSFRRDHIPGVDELDNGSYVLGVFPARRGNLRIFSGSFTTKSRKADLWLTSSRYMSKPGIEAWASRRPLIDRYLDIIKAEDIEIVTLENWSGSSYLSDMLERMGFAEYVRLFALDRRR